MECSQDKYGLNLETISTAVNKRFLSQSYLSQLVFMFNSGCYEELEIQTRLLAERFPDSGLIWKVLGAALQAQGKDSLAAMQMATMLLPDDSEAHYNFSNALQDKKQYQAAVLSCIRAIEINPDFAEAHCNLGVALKELGQITDAVASYVRAIEIKPNFAEAHNNLGIAWKELGQLDKAEASYRRALEINKHYAEAYSNLGGVLRAQDKLAEALFCYQQQAKLTPENEIALHHIASLTGQKTERAPNQYIESAFDSYADKFDSHLQQVLKYEVPEKLVALVMQHAHPQMKTLNILDLGCGTGLVGLAIAPFSRQLVGVDLSNKMLEKAHSRSIYERLEKLDLLTMMQSEKTSIYDVIFAADVLIYSGKLDLIIAEVKRLLCPSGLFAFSIESLDYFSNENSLHDVGLDWQLETNGRYTHSIHYVKRLACSNKFYILEITPTQIRLENAKAVNGYLVLCKSRGEDFEMTSGGKL